MKVTTLIIPAIVIAAGFGITRTAFAAPFQNASQVEGKCNDKGGAYFGKSAKGVYGCLYQDGSGVACGGTGKDRKTCSSWTADMKILPTRDQIRTAQTKPQAK
jgi:hypothetical protein